VGETLSLAVELPALLPGSAEEEVVFTLEVQQVGGDCTAVESSGRPE
jgi:hypothetical protein